MFNGKYHHISMFSDWYPDRRWTEYAGSGTSQKWKVSFIVKIPPFPPPQKKKSALETFAVIILQ